MRQIQMTLWIHEFRLIECTLTANSNHKKIVGNGNIIYDRIVHCPPSVKYNNKILMCFQQSLENNVNIEFRKLRGYQAIDNIHLSLFFEQLLYLYCANQFSILLICNVYVSLRNSFSSSISYFEKTCQLNGAACMCSIFRGSY